MTFDRQRVHKRLEDEKCVQIRPKTSVFWLIHTAREWNQDREMGMQPIGPRSRSLSVSLCSAYS